MSSSLLLEQTLLVLMFRSFDLNLGVERLQEKKLSSIVYL